MAESVTIVEDVSPITKYGLAISVVFTATTWAAFSLGSGELYSQFRNHPRSTEVLWSCSTVSGEITRPGSYTVVVTIPDSAGEALSAAPYVYFDFVHEDGGVYTAIPALIKWPTAPVVTKKVDL
ncbi:MAG: hypothetical protein KDA17_07750 [Candidatus Saccharibacteria bacterium]|nr:hypothetical protein [Candidatus Saccharibacteria bacterium]